MSEPQLSIVVVVLAGRVALARCLDAVRALRGVDSIETIVAYDDHHPDVDSLIARHPDLVFAQLPGRRTCAEIRSHGMRLAHAPVVALTEDHCVPDPDWGRAILDAHRTAHAAIGGPVDKRGTDHAIAWAVYLLDYSRYASPLAEGPARGLTDCNVSYKRSALVAIESVWRTEFHEPEVHDALRRHGATLWQTPAIVVRQQRSLTPSAALRERFDFGRLFGALRARDASPARRVLLTLASVLVPPLLIWRLRSPLQRAPELRAPLLRALPSIVVLALAWGLGEAVGHATARAPRSQQPRAGVRPGAA